MPPSRPWLLVIIAPALLALLNCTSNKSSSVSYSKADLPRFTWAADWSPDGNYIALGGDDSVLGIYHAKDLSVYKRYSLNGAIKHLAWHPKENLLAVATTKGAQLLDLSTHGPRPIEDIRIGGRAIGWNYSGELLALADGAGVVQVMTNKGKILRSIKKHNNHSYAAIDWHPHKNIIATGSDEIIIFDTSGKELAFIQHRKEHTLMLALDWHPSGNFLASGDYGHEKEGMPTLLQFWKEDGTLIKQMRGHHEEMRRMKWSSDGRFLATGSDGLRIWNTEGKLLHEAVLDEVLWGVAWSPDNTRIVTGSFGSGKIRLWTNEAKLLKSFP